MMQNKESEVANQVQNATELPSKLKAQPTQSKSGLSWNKALRIEVVVDCLGAPSSSRFATTVLAMPGPGPHLIYAMGSGLALTTVSNGRFGPHHTLTYTINAFFGPDIGSFSKWLGDTIGIGLGSALAGAIHHPFYYVLILGLPLCFFYSWLSGILIQKGVLDSVSGVPLSKMQCLLLVSAGSLSHFFLDHLFEENGHSTMYTWILSTGWWKNRAPINPDAVVVIGFLCTCLIGGFIFINRVKIKSIKEQSFQSVKLIMAVASLYCLWCVSQIYWVNPRRAAVGEEADLGVFIFLATYFYLPHFLCISSMNPNDGQQLSP